MIRKQDILDRAAEWGPRPDVVEKDYVLGWLLAGFADNGTPNGATWSTADAARKAWQEAAERNGVLVFHFSRLGDIREVRGVSLFELPYPVVILNGADLDEGRSFTLLHECAHLALRSGAVCDLHGSKREEVFCNAVAACALMPRAEVLALSVVGAHRSGTRWLDAEVREIANRFRVSSEAALRRLLELGLAARGEYGAWREKYAVHVEKAHDSGSGGNAIYTIRRNVGAKFLRVVKSGVDEGFISLHSASQAVGVGAPTFDKLTGLECPPEPSA